MKFQNNSSLLEKFKLLSVNQLAGQIELMELWKSVNIEKYPIELISNEKAKEGQHQSDGMTTRKTKHKQFKDWSKTKVAESSFTTDAAKLWNMAPKEIKNVVTISAAEAEIFKFCNSLPI